MRCIKTVSMISIYACTYTSIEQKEQILPFKLTYALKHTTQIKDLEQINAIEQSTPIYPNGAAIMSPNGRLAVIYKKEEYNGTLSITIKDTHTNRTLICAELQEPAPPQLFMTKNNEVALQRGNGYNLWYIQSDQFKCLSAEQKTLITALSECTKVSTSLSDFKSPRSPKKIFQLFTDQEQEILKKTYNISDDKGYCIIS